MPIAPLQIPTNFQSQSLDFSPLANLGTIYQKAKQDTANKEALATGDPNALIRSGDSTLASLGINMLRQKDALTQQALDNARNTKNDDFSHGMEQQRLSLARAAAARANDPTPANFVKDPTVPGGYRPIGPADPAYLEQVAAAKARAAALLPPDGFTRGADGVLAPMPGGPTDPTYLGKVDAEKARAKGDVPTVIGPMSSVIIPNKAADGPLFKNSPAASSGFSPEALDIRASQWMNGDYEGATKGLGRGAQGSEALTAIANRAAETLVAKGLTPEQAAGQISSNMQKFKASGVYQNTESRTGASREANLNIILKAADAAIPAALEASEKVSRTGFVPLNKIIQQGKVATSDPDLRAFGMANLQLAEHWARAMNPTGVMRESDRDMALHFLSLADTKDTYKSSVMQLKTQITRERDAIRSSTPGHQAPAPETNAGTGNRTAGGVPWSIQ